MNKAKLAETVTAAQSGDKDAVEKLYRQYRERIWFFVCKNVSSKQAAEDIVSDTFLTAVEKLPELRCADAFGSWLYSIAYTKCMAHLNSESEIARFDTDDELEASIENSRLSEPVQLPGDYIENEQTKRLLREAINSLKPQTRSLIIMYYFEEMSVAEVAQVLGIKNNAAKQRLFAARKKLASKLKKLCSNGSSLCVVPLGAVLNASFDSSAAASAKASGAAVKAGFTAKLAAAGIAAAVVAGIPLALVNSDSKGDYRPDNSIVSQDIDLEKEAENLLKEISGKSFSYRFETCPAMELVTDSSSVSSVLVQTKRNSVEQGQMYDYGLSEFFLKYKYLWSVSQKDSSVVQGVVCMTHRYADPEMEIKLYCSAAQKGENSAYKLYLPVSNSDRFICIELTDPDKGRYLLDDMGSHRVKGTDHVSELFETLDDRSLEVSYEGSDGKVSFEACRLGENKFGITLRPDVNILQDTDGMFCTVEVLRRKTGESAACPVKTDAKQFTAGSGEGFIIEYTNDPKADFERNIEISDVPDDCDSITVSVSCKRSSDPNGSTADHTVRFTADISGASKTKGQKQDI